MLRDSMTVSNDMQRRFSAVAAETDVPLSEHRQTPILNGIGDFLPRGPMQYRINPEQAISCADREGNGKCGPTYETGGEVDRLALSRSPGTPGHPHPFAGSSPDLLPGQSASDASTPLPAAFLTGFFLHYVPVGILPPVSATLNPGLNQHRGTLVSRSFGTKKPGFSGGIS